MPSSDLPTTTSQEISFQPAQLTIKLQKVTDCTFPVSPLPSKYSSQKPVQTSSRRELPSSTEIEWFEGEDTTEEVEELVKNWYIHMDGIVLFTDVR